ncbi:MAG: hypothetical protein ACI88H_001239 [Cocleimonas sp.]
MIFDTVNGALSVLINGDSAIIKNGDFEDSEKLAKTLNQLPPYIKVLKFIHCKFDTESSKVLSEYEKLAKIVELEFNSVIICLVSLKSIVDSNYLSSLSHLKVNYCLLGKDGLEVILLSCISQQIKTLEFKGNKLSLEEEYYEVFASSLPKLLYLNLGHNMLHSPFVFNLIANLSQLTYLNVEHNLLGKNEASRLLINKTKLNSSLKYLNLEHCYLSSQHIDIIFSRAKLPSLKALLLGYNRIKDKGLLILSNNTSLTNITVLNLNRNHITNFGVAEFSIRFSINKLQELNLSNNNLDSGCYSALIRLANSISLFKLNLSCNVFDENIFGLNLKYIKCLDLSNCKITSGIKSQPYTGIFNNLESLSLTNNSLCETGFVNLQDNLDLEKLKYLDLSHNEIRCNIFNFLANSSLKKLKLDHNYIEINLPSDAKKENIICNIEELSLLGCSIFPTIFLGFLKINFTCLNKLDLRSNNLNHDYVLELAKSSLLSQDIKINLNQNIGLFLPYLNNWNELKSSLVISTSESKVTNDTLRLCLVGQPYAGKTTIFRKILDPSYIPSNDIYRTIGIDRESTPILLEAPELNRLNLDVWDFGGDELQHMCHSLFLSGEAIYCLVIDANTTIDNIHHWLLLIQHFSSDKSLNKAWVIPIINKKLGKGASFIWPHESLVKQYKGLKLYSPITVDPNVPSIEFRFIKQLKELMKTYPFKKIWKSITDTVLLLDNVNRDYISLDDFDELLDENYFYESFIKRVDLKEEQITKDSLYDQILSYLNELGRVHCFYNLNIIVLNYKWLEKGIYMLLPPDDQLLIDNRDLVNDFKNNIRTSKGMFRKPDLIRVWSEAGLKFQRRSGKDALFQILEKDYLNIIYPVNERLEQYFVPAYLNEALGSNEENYICSKLKSLILKSDFYTRIEADYVPNHSIYKIMVQYHKEIKVKGNIHQQWKDKVIISLTNNIDGPEVLVLYSNGALWLFLMLNGFSKKLSISRYFRILDYSHSIVGVNKSFIKTPCPVCISIRSSEYSAWGWFNFDRNLQANTSDKISCDVCLAEMKITDIINQKKIKVKNNSLDFDSIKGSINHINDGFTANSSIRFGFEHSVMLISAFLFDMDIFKLTDSPQKKTTSKARAAILSIRSSTKGELGHIQNATNDEKWKEWLKKCINTPDKIQGAAITKFSLHLCQFIDGLLAIMIKESGSLIGDVPLNIENLKKKKKDNPQILDELNTLLLYTANQIVSDPEKIYKAIFRTLQYPGCPALNVVSNFMDKLGVTTEESQRLGIPEDYLAEVYRFKEKERVPTTLTN